MSKDLKLINLSDGTTNGIVLFYMKNGKLHPILLKEEQAQMLDFVIKTPFAESKMCVHPDAVEYQTIKHMLK